MKRNIVQDGVAYKLRSVSINDAQLIIDIRLEDESRNQYIHKISNDLAAQQSWIETYLERDNDYYFVLENRLTGQAEGLVGIYDIDGGKAEWGRWVIKKGSLASIECIDLVFRVAFDVLKLNEVYSRTIEENKSVVAFHNSLPQLLRGVLENHSELNGVRYNVVEHYVTADYYKTKLQRMLEHKSLLIFQRNFKTLFGKMEFHHIGVACTDIEQEFSNFRLLGYEREDDVFEDENQGIRGQFITAPNQPRLELLENLQDSKTLDMWIKNRVKMYHFAYKVDNIEEVQLRFNRNRIKTLSPLKYSTYFGKRICFLMLPNMYLIELIEN